ncbi:MAG: MipA/OmpV family protein [Pseudomonadota bacterium]
MSLSRICLAFSCAAVLSSAQAQSATDPVAAAPAPAASSWALGVGAQFSRSPYRGVGNRTAAIPLILYDGSWLRVRGNVLDLKLPPAGPLAFSLRAKYALGAGYEADDSSYLSGMAERKGGLMLGAASEWRSPLGKVSLEWLGDVSDHSKGQNVRLGLERGYRLGAFNLTPHLGLTWMDRKYVDYYYGVRAEEALPGRPAYQGASTTNAELGLRVDYGLTPASFISVDAGYERLGGAIEDSALVERQAVPSLRLGYLYNF